MAKAHLVDLVRGSKGGAKVRDRYIDAIPGIAADGARRRVPGVVQVNATLGVVFIVQADEAVKLKDLVRCDPK